MIVTVYDKGNIPLYVESVDRVFQHSTGAMSMWAGGKRLEEVPAEAYSFFVVTEEEPCKNS